MKVLITGCNGQLGYELQRHIPKLDTQSITLIAMDVDQLDITNAKQVAQIMAEQQPNWVINGAAYTAVDKAESDLELAEAINTTGAKNIAQACQQNNIKMIHISTDFIFDGKNHKPYQTNEAASPISVYGQTKYLGEQYVQQLLPQSSLILRTAWLYSAHGNNFVKTMLRLMQERDELGIVADQIGSPTWAATLANLCWRHITQYPQLQGIYHCSDNGVASWYDFAVTIQEKALQLGLLNQRITIKPIAGSAYPTPAKRPHYSVMDKASTEKAFDISFPHWQSSLQSMLCELKQ